MLQMRFSRTVLLSGKRNGVCGIAIIPENDLVMFSYSIIGRLSGWLKIGL